ncbi:MAG: hypothetical protein MUP10_04505, partial [Methanoregulaceae archaeon]|nr:hypothetical protein [Methanoregulaceae archaeon]
VGSTGRTGQSMYCPSGADFFWIFFLIGCRRRARECCGINCIPPGPQHAASLTGAISSTVA